MLKMKGVDMNNPPQIPVFDKSKYKYPNSKQAKYDECNDKNILQYIEKSEGYIKI
jgi:hypothetical protein